MISIIIPTLSREEHASHFQTLTHLLSQYLPAQTHTDFEALVLADGKNNRVRSFITSLNDSRISYHETPETRQWGHPQTREGISLARGEFFLRMNDDNIPYPRYLETLVSGFAADIGVSYARVRFRSSHRASFNRWYKIYGVLRFGYPFIMPKDPHGKLEHRNIDCMNYMVRMALAKQHISAWSDDCNADWQFLERILKSGAKAKFVNRVIGDKY